MAKVSDEKKLEKLVDNMAIVARQMALIGPQIPTLTREMIGTLKERLVATLEELGQVGPDELIEARYERLRALGQLEGS